MLEVTVQKLKEASKDRKTYYVLCEMSPSFQFHLIAPLHVDVQTETTPGCLLLCLNIGG